MLLSPVAAILLLRTAPVQTYLAHRVASYLSEELNTRVSVGGFRLNWFLEAVITDITILDRHNNVLLQASKIKADVKSLDVKGHQIHLNEIALANGSINMVYYVSDSSLNLQFIIDHFSSPAADTSPSTPWAFGINKVKLKETHFAYRDERYMSPGKGIDFSDMDFSKINLEVKNIQFLGDSVLADFQQFAFVEKSGFQLNDFSAQALVCPRGIEARNLKITTSKSRLSLDLKFEYGSYNAFNDFIDSVKITSAILPSQLDMQDLISFAPDLDGMYNIIDFSGNIKGTVSSFAARGFKFTTGMHTSFKGNIQMNGLPDLAETFINLKMDDFYTNMDDIQSFKIPFNDSLNTIVLPVEILPLGNIKINGRFTGFYNDFVSKATFITDVGQLTTDLLLTNNKANHTNEYDGKILVESFDAGKMFNVSQLGTLDLYAVVKGKNFSLDKADLVMKGEITNLQYEGNTFGLISIDGEFKQKKFGGGVFINDELLALDFAGSVDFSEKLPAFDFKADIAHANLKKLNLLTNDSIALLSTRANLNFQGNTLDNLIGSLQFNNTQFTRGHTTIKMNLLSINTMALENGGKRMQLSSDFADAVFTGQYTFDDMAEYLTMAFTNFLPSLANSTKQQERLNRGSFDYTLRLHHTGPLTEMFLPWLRIHDNTVISGTFEPTLGLININGRSPLVTLSGFSLHNWAITGNSAGKSMNVHMESSQVDRSASDKPDQAYHRIEQFKLDAVVADDSVNFTIGWDDMNKDDHNKSDIAGAMSFKQNPRLTLKLTRADILINDTLWQVVPENLLVLDSAYFEAQNFGFGHTNRRLVINGIASPDPLSKLTARIDGFNLSNLDGITNASDFDLDGFLNGNVSVTDLFSVPHISSDVTVSKFAFNHENLGDAAIKSEWDNRTGSIGIDMQVVYVGNVGTHFPVKVTGNIYPEKEHNNFDLDIVVDNLRVRTIEPFLKGVFSRIRGFASGEITLKGDFADPVLKGKLNLMRTEMLIDYLRASYSFTGDFNFDKDVMWFKNIALTDSTFGTGVVSGYIRHKAFSDWSLDVELQADKLVALNTPYSPVEMYYGKAKATGTMTLKGPVDNLVLRANMKAEKGTGVFIPITFSRGISENSFIQYQNNDDSAQSGIVQNPVESSVLSLQLGLDVTRYADIGIILPYQMGTIDVRGSGLINMGIDSRGEFSMFGQYIMDNGNFLFNFENILKKNFAIQKGGHITFNGSPYDSDIGLQAIYKVKTSLTGLNVQEEYKSTRVNVDCIINLSNSLYNPDIKFSINLPDASDEMKRQIFSLIDTSNSIEMNQQMISLLVLNTFSSTSGISSSGGTLGISSYELLSAQVNRMLSQISKDFDIGVNYRPGDQLSPKELELALSTQLFDNRVTINGAVGNSYNTTNQTNQFIGDVLVEVKITEDGRFRVKGFNRTNSSFDLYGYSPYTQGVEILFRKEFNTLEELFTRKKKIVLPEKKEDLK